ncbi:MAG: hypothetical protein P857_1008 [Candidatus Xenolissoclinum pacificiensis L6]|uniref:Uncharacterized protein n=1 Tax=Candidatus Xenolissoclinum pacificiensis L6 TaxID=1401685 RepID=W2V156_9RICK|nr:MAG: hypothetical protein P857_1008 [Candidatus Xenolissoclinum pacificiensis L6]
MPLQLIQEADNFLRHSSIEQYSYLRALWRAVILQAFVDCTSEAKRTENQVEKQRAIHWLTEMNRDFILVCRLADYNPCFIRNKALQILNNTVTHKKTRQMFLSVSRNK